MANYCALLLFNWWSYMSQDRWVGIYESCTLHTILSYSYLEFFMTKKQMFMIIWGWCKDPSQEAKVEVVSMQVIKSPKFYPIYKNPFWRHYPPKSYWRLCSSHWNCVSFGLWGLWKHQHVQRHLGRYKQKISPISAMHPLQQWIQT